MSIDHSKIRAAIIGDKNFEKLNPKLKEVVLKRTTIFVEKLISILIKDQEVRKIV